MWITLKKWFLSKILRRYYYRTGKCNACGKCCTQIYVKHYKHVIKDEKEFTKLQYLHSFYSNLNKFVCNRIENILMLSLLVFFF